MGDRYELEVFADLDVPGETGRQTQVFAIWVVCLLAALGVAVARRPQVPATARSSEAYEESMALYRRERFGIAIGVGVLIPGLLTWALTHRRRRGGGHARGIQVAVTEDGELRISGRGYGQRLSLLGATVEEHLVDVYSGRLGAWRQRRMRLRAARPSPGMPGELDLATPAEDEDLDLDLPLVGGEGDCLELDRAAYFRVLRLARRWSSRVETESSR
ncbi:MAG: hypothetical protein KC731_32280 [Myxococcales bacterium]|nr:hypothetical protein [Myxococcales bacterium]